MKNWRYYFIILIIYTLFLFPKTHMDMVTGEKKFMGKMKRKRNVVYYICGGLMTTSLLMILTYMFALMGIQSAPAFTMWSFGNASPKPFAPQQVWASSFCIGLILFFFTAFQGMGAKILELAGNPAFADIGQGNARPWLLR